MEPVVVDELHAMVEIAECEAAQDGQYLVDDVDELCVDVDDSTEARGAWRSR